MRLKFEDVEYESELDENAAYDEPAPFVLPDGRILSVNWRETSPPQVGDVRDSGAKVILLKLAT